MKLNINDIKVFNIYKWWNNNKNSYPILYKIAKDFLAIQSSSTSSEQLFSESAMVITKRRNRLNDDTVEAIMCIKSWNKLFEKNVEK